MKSVACSNMWNNLTINVPTKVITHCCKMERVPVSEEQLVKLDGDLNSIPYFLQQKVSTIETNKLQASCSKCIASFPNSLWSSWNKWKDVDWDESELAELHLKDKMRRIDIFLNNTCNLSCMYCSETYSNTWANLKGISIVEDKGYHDAMVESLYRYIEKYHSSTLREDSMTYNFLGGEPFLNPKIFSIIETITGMYIQPSKKVVFSITSNLCVKPKVISNFINLIKNNRDFKWIITASIDAVGSVGENIRTGLDFELFRSNLLELYTSGVIDVIEIQPAMNALSVKHFDEFLKWISSELGGDSFGDKWTIRNNMVNNPKEMEVSILPTEYKKYIDECIATCQILLKDCADKISLIEFLDMLIMNIGSRRSPLDLMRAKTFYEKQGKLKNVDYIELFPELTEILNESGS